MCCRWKVLALPLLALLLAGGVLVVSNVSAGTGDVPDATAGQQTTQAVDSTTPQTIAQWQETGNVRGRPPTNPTNPPVHTIQP
jgi:hypothetical protein